MKYFCRNQKETRTNKISAGTSTKGPITPANACPEFSPKTAIATAIANSKLFPAAVNATAVVLSYSAPDAFVTKNPIINIIEKLKEDKNKMVDK